MGGGTILVDGYRLLEEIFRPGRVVHGVYQESGTEGERIPALRVKLAGLLRSNQANRIKSNQIKSYQIDKVLGPKTSSAQSACIAEGKEIREDVQVLRGPQEFLNLCHGFFGASLHGV